MGSVTGSTEVVERAARKREGEKGKQRRGSRDVGREAGEEQEEVKGGYRREVRNSAEVGCGAICLIIPSGT